LNIFEAPDYLLMAVTEMEAFALLAANAGWLRSVSRALFFSLITLDLVWSAGITPMMGGWSPAYYGRFLVRRVFAYFAAFFVWEYYGDLVPALVNGLATAATAILGPPVDGGQWISPGHVWGTGIQVSMQFMKLHLTPILGSALGPGFYLPLVFLIMAAFGLLAILMALVRIELLLALIAGYPLLALGGHPITKAVAAGYIRWVMNIGVRMFFFVLLGTFAQRVGHLFLTEAEADVRWMTSPIVTLAPFPAFVMLAIVAVSVTRISREITTGFSWHPGPWDVGHGLREEK
jgi:hypothetical protein